MCVTVTWHGWASGWRKPGWWVEIPGARSLPSWRKSPYRTWLCLTSPVMVHSYPISQHTEACWWSHSSAFILMCTHISICFFLHAPFNYNAGTQVLRGQNPNHTAALNVPGLCELSLQLLWVMYSFLSIAHIFSSNPVSLIRAIRASGHSSGPWITPHSLSGSRSNMLFRMGVNHTQPLPSTERASGVQIRPQDPFIIRLGPAFRGN